MINKLSVAAVLVACLPAFGDWPTHMGDSLRGGVCGEAVNPGGEPAWVYDAGLAPSPGFYPELKETTLGPQKIVAPTSTFDFAYPIIAGGGRTYFASSSQDAVFCLDSKSGAKVWSFFTEGPVRFAPVLDGGRLYFGSDDGFVYCVGASDGKLVWKWTAAPEKRTIIANGRLASQWPVRTSVALHEGVVYFAAGLFPADGGVFLCALKAADGSLVWKKNAPTACQGYILVAEDCLFVPNGRASPCEYSIKDGSLLVPANTETRREGGGAFIAGVGGMVMYGPNEYGILRIRAVAGDQSAYPTRAIRGKITGIAGWRVAIKDKTAYLLRSDGLQALPADDFRQILVESAEQYKDRVKSKKITEKSGVQQKADSEAEKQIAGKVKWQGQVKGGRSLIITANHAIVGGEGEVAGFGLADGKEAFRLKVEGVAWELAASDGLLLVSTSAGKVYCFGDKADRKGIIRAAAESAPADNASFASRLAKAVLTADRRKGFCLVLGAGDGKLACELARLTEYRIVCVEKDAAAAARARETIIRAGMYGSRVTVHERPDGKLPYIRYFANLIVSQDAQAGGFDAEEAFACLRPFGGVMAMPAGADTGWGAKLKGWSVVETAASEWRLLVRGPLEGAGEWTHMFADPANTACSGDRLVGGRAYRLQWFGDPSPLRDAGWHYNGMGPLYKDGRMFLIRTDHLEAVDIYNGTSLWHADMPGSARFNIAREGGSACVDDRKLYLAVKNDCQAFDVRDGKKLKSFAGPDEKADWGFIAVCGDKLLGTNQKTGATVSDTKQKGLLRSVWSSSETELVVSQTLFALDKESGKLLWQYGGEGKSILNPSIAIDGQRVYFVESRSPKAAQDEDGSILLRDFLGKDTFLVALDFAGGKPLWERPYSPPARSVLYLSCASGKLIASYSYFVGPLADMVTSDAAATIAGKLGGKAAGAETKIAETKIRFGFEALDPANGKTLWNSEYTSTGAIGAQHNYNVSHPVFTDKAIYYCPPEQHLAILDYDAGKIAEKTQIKRGKGCTTPTGSLLALFYRSTGVGSYDIASGRQFYVSDVSRTSCWMNVLPAGGLLLMPEYSVGCNCAFPLQTTVVLAPGNFAESPEPTRPPGPPADDRSD
ncbi:MAG: PQQ-binding-like beta-propeller repeat protein [Planctomycetes bacterium]|nr:PQQ-binding-like beta-propeller repeat protein [Planctomycetota bacterium]